MMIVPSEFGHEIELSYREVVVYINQARSNIYTQSTHNICQSIISSDVLFLPSNTSQSLTVCYSCHCSLRSDLRYLLVLQRHFVFMGFQASDRLQLSL